MSRVVVIVATALAVTSLAGCVGKGKGKAPPPVMEPAPVQAPVYK
ncbi:ABC transporter [Chelativorans sp. YIM 93263]|nr:ABC transporter [Chelativorans sp. YIM 93263]